MLEAGTPAPNVAVLGLGRVGLVSAACLAAAGYSVQGFDSDPARAASIRQGHCPFAEPGLEPRLQQALSSGCLSIAGDVPQALHQTGIAMVCVGTPALSDGSADLSQLQQVLGDLARVKAQDRKPLVIAIRSTVFAGVCESMLAPRFADLPHVSLVMHPEFMREGVAVTDFEQPALCVIGGVDPGAVALVASLYTPFGISVHRTTARSAEMVKILSNAFHALKVAFANEAGSIGQSAGVDMDEVMSIFCQDRTLNVSPAYLRPGMPFGGACLVKDLQNLTRHAAASQVAAPLLEAVLDSNRQHFERLAQAALALPARRLALIGLSFKDGTGDLRDSPLLWLLDRLRAEGRSVRYYDPLLPVSADPHRSPHLSHLLDWSDALIVGKGLSSQEQQIVNVFNGPILDARALPPLQGLRYMVHPASAGS